MKKTKSKIRFSKTQLDILGKFVSAGHTVLPTISAPWSPGRTFRALMRKGLLIRLGPREVMLTQEALLALHEQLNEQRSRANDQ